MINTINHLHTVIKVGVPTVGDHTVELSPVASSSSVNHWVHCTVILKTIEKN